MTADEAVEAIVILNGGHLRAIHGGIRSFAFPGLSAADRCKAILDALLPAGSTGVVHGPGRLLVSSIPAEAEAP